jgi:predicted nucleotidyltransferase
MQESNEAMIGRTEAALRDLPPHVQRSVSEFVQALVGSLGSRLKSVVLFGSAAEGRLRSTSDVNVLVVATELDPARLGLVRESLRTGRVAAGLTAMFVEATEFDAACEAFAVKFADMQYRHRVLWGSEPFANAVIPREATIRRLKQVLLNLKLRLRERFVLDGDRPDALALDLANATGPIRASAATLLHLLDGRTRTPKAALEELFPGERWASCLAGLSAAHRGEVLPGRRMEVLMQDVQALLSSLAADAAALR